MSTVVADFAARAREAPEAPAVIEDGRLALTYGALARRAEGVARGLRALGVGREDLVALSLPRSADLVAALLGTWLAGAAFVPVLPDLPAARRRLLREGTRVTLGRDGLDPARLAAAAPRPDLPGPADLAYVIHTSGSTGTPKGVEVEHGALQAVIRAQVPAFGLGPGRTALWILSPAFDASLSDLMTTLSSGAALALERSPLPPPGPDLLALLGRRGVTHLDLPPSWLPLLDPDQAPPTLSTLVIGGEAPPADAVRRWSSRCRVVNVYGPTEACICTSLVRCRADWSEPLLGDPLPGVEYSVRDEDGNPVAPGEAGELWIGGGTLARGYRGDPERTERAFPWREGRRWYRTGDRVREGAGGGLRFLGRLDRQVKVRGLRVEPEEVEVALRSHPAVVRAAVVPLREGDRAVGFEAFVEGSAAPGALRAHLGERLPSWMVPRHVTVVERLPLTESGKVDLSALAPGTGEGAQGGPGGSLVDQVRALWEQVLGRRPLPEEDWTSAGGDSFSLLVLAARCGAAGLPLAPEDLARCATPIAQARLVTGRGGRSGGWRRTRSLAADARPDPALRDLLDTASRRPGGTAAARPALVVLTGATGFLGSRVLRGLLEATAARVVCPVRAPDAAGARLRLGPDLAAEERVEALPGDLALPRMGLPEARWARLAEEAGLVVHCGAEVNTALPYPALRPANLLGTRSALWLQAVGSTKRLAVASTLSVLVAADREPGLLLESDDATGAERVFGGYAQSKWAAESLLRESAGRGGPLACVRFGLLTGDTATGRGAPRDLMALFLRGLAGLGCLPRGDWESLRMDVTPVDHAAAAMVHLALGGEGVYHVAGARTASLADLVRALERRGLRVRPVSLREWRDLAGRHASAAEAAAWFGAARLLSAGESRRSRGLDLFAATGFEFDCRRAEEALRGSGVERPAWTEDLLDLYVRRILEAP